MEGVSEPMSQDVQQPLFSQDPPVMGAASATWRSVLEGEKQKPYFKEVLNFVEQERARGKVIYPPNSNVFSALQLTPFDKVKVVVLGQDPYHGPNQAHGLCFSVQPGIAKPPSLVNIFKELKADLGLEPPPHGCLRSWAEQGVLLLNTTLTVEATKPLSHGKVGWEQFTDRVIAELNDKREHIVFLLWGAHAQRKGALIDRARHCVLQAPHPSPFSADRGFFGCRHFSKANEYLVAHGSEPIDWRLPAEVPPHCT